MHTLQTETVLQLVKEVVKKPHQIKGEQVNKHTYKHFRGVRLIFPCFVKSLLYFSLHQKSTLVDIPMLQFSYAYVQRYLRNTMLVTSIRICFRYILFKLCFSMQHFSSDSAGKCSSSPQFVTGVCSAQPGPAWTLLAAGVSFLTHSVTESMTLIRYLACLLHLLKIFANSLLEKLILIKGFCLSEYSTTLSIGSLTWKTKRTVEISRYDARCLVLAMMAIASQCV